MLLVALATLYAQNAPTFADRNPRYHLQPGDVIEVSYTYTPEYNQTLPIEPDGYATLRLIGSVKLSDLTLDDATSELKRQASTKLNDPEITVVLKEYVKPHIVVSGEVNRPGSFDLHGKASAMEAIAWSGGFKDTSQQSQVLLIRRVDSEFAQVRVLDFKKLSSPKGVNEDVQLSPNDILVVPKNRLGKVEPYVRVASLGLTALYGVAILK